MTISTYTELQSAAASWLHRSDMTSVITDCIALAEERFNRRLRTKAQELVLASTTIDASYQVAIPTNTLAIKRIWRTGTPVTVLDAASLDYVMQRQVGALATAYAWEDGYWRFDGTGTVAGVLYRNIPPLASNSTNWLLTAHPSAYLFATLAETAAFTQDATNGGIWESKAERAIGEIMVADKRDSFSGPLLVRAA